jgi:hypothetical protein
VKLEKANSDQKAVNVTQFFCKHKKVATTACYLRALANLGFYRTFVFTAKVKPTSFVAV